MVSMLGTLQREERRTSPSFDELEAGVHAPSTATTMSSSSSDEEDSAQWRNG